MAPSDIIITIALFAVMIGVGYWGFRLKRKQQAKVEAWFFEMPSIKQLRAERFSKVSDNQINGQFLGHNVGCYYLTYRNKPVFYTYINTKLTKDWKGLGQFDKKYETEHIEVDQGGEQNFGFRQKIEGKIDYYRIMDSFKRLTEIEDVEGKEKRLPTTAKI